MGGCALGGWHYAAMAWATDSHGNELLDIAVESAPRPDHDTVPLTGALVVVTGPQGLLLVHDVWRGQWELAGGGVEPGETSEQAALREVAEESGQHLTSCRRVGSATFRLAAAGVVERADLFCGVVEDVEAFEPSAEIDAIRWWDGVTRAEEVGAIDVALLRWALEHGSD